MTTTRAAPRGTRTSAAPADYREAVDALSDIAAVLNTEMALDSLLHVICDKACTLLGIAHVSLYLKDGESGELRGQVARYERDVDEIIKGYVAGGPADVFTRQILESKQPVLVRDAQNDPRPVRAQMRRWDVRAIFGVPMILAEEVVGVFYFDNGAQPYPFSDAQQELAQVFANFAAAAVEQAAGRLRLRASLTTIARQNRVLKRLSTISDRLTSVVLEGGTGMADVAAAIAELTRNPCVIHDGDGRRLAEAGAEDIAVCSPLDEGPNGHPQAREGLAALGGERVAAVGPLPAAGLPRRCLVAAVTVGSERAGYLVVEERRGCLGMLETAIAQRATTVIALELAAARRGLEAEGDGARALLTDLLAGRLARPVVERRAERLRVDLLAPHVLAILAPRSAVERPPAAVEVAEAVAAASSLPGQGQPNVLAAELDGAVAVVLRLAAENGLQSVDEAKSRLRTAVAGLLPQGELLGGLSSPCADPADYRRARFEATQIVALLRAHSHPGEAGLLVLSSDELGASRLLLASHGPAELDAYLADVLGDLHDSSDPKMMPLLETVSHYLSAGSSTGRTAAALGIHENSVRNRLARVSELTGLDLVNDGEARMRLQLAIHGLELRRQLDRDGVA